MLVFRFLPFILFVFLNSIMVKLWKTKFGYALPITLMITALIMYIFGMILHSFSGAYILVAITGGIAIIVFVIEVRKPEFRELFFSNGFYCLLILSVIIFFMDLGHKFAIWDEFSHWGKMVKEMLRLNTFYSEPESTLLVHKDYPPFLSLFETLWCKFSGGFSEATVTRGIHYFELGLIVPYLAERIENREGKHIVKMLKTVGLIFVLMLFIMVFSGGELFCSIYSDVVVSILFALAVFYLLDKEIHGFAFTYFAIVLIQISLILVKQVSISFVLLIWLFFIMMYLKKGKMVAPLCASVGLLLGPLLAYLSWSKYTKALGVIGQFDFSRISISEVLDILLGGGNKAQADTSRLYIKALFMEPITQGTVELSYVVGGLILVLLLLFFFYKNGKKDSYIAIKLCVLSVIGLIGYALMMHVLYMFCYSEGEMYALASYSRYMGCFLLGEYLIVLYYLIMMYENVAEEVVKNRDKFICFLIVALLLFEGSNLLYVFPRLHGDVGCDECRTEGEYLLNGTEENSRILLVGSNILNEAYHIQFFLDTQTLDPDYLYVGVTDFDVEDEEAWNKLVESIERDNYVYIYSKSRALDEVLGIYTDNGSLDERGLYKVGLEEGDLRLFRQP